MVKKKVSFGKLEINFTNRSLYTLIAFFIVVTLGVGVYALQPGVSPNPGHSIQGVSPPSGCNDGEFLKWVYFPGSSGQGEWKCASVSGSVGGGGDFAYADWFSGSGMVMSSLENKLVSISDRTGEGRKLTIQAGTGLGSVAVNGGELKLSSGASFQGGTSFMSFYTSSGGTVSQRYNPTEKMRILGDGRVGIGTTNPLTKLDVSGQVKGTSFCIGNSCITSWPAGSSTTTISEGTDGSDGADGASGGSGGSDGSDGQDGSDGSAGLARIIGTTSQSYTGLEVGGYDGGDEKCVETFGEGSRMATAVDFALGRPSRTDMGWYNTFTGFYAVNVNDNHKWNNDCYGWQSDASYATGSFWGVANYNPGPGNVVSPMTMSCDTPKKILCVEGRGFTSECVILPAGSSAPAGYTLSEGYLEGYGNLPVSSCTSKCTQFNIDCPSLNTWQPVSIDGTTCFNGCEANPSPPTGGNCDYLNKRITLNPQWGSLKYCKS